MNRQPVQPPRGETPSAPAPSRTGDPSTHVPVMVDAIVEALAPRDDALYVDGTFGAGGYSRALLEAAHCRVVAIDRDPDAARHGREFARTFDRRIEIVEGNFGDMERLLAGRSPEPVAGIALDLGVSSTQIDTPERGFSFRVDGPLDMRMSNAGQSAADLVATLAEEDLVRLIRDFGEEKFARRIARTIVAARREQPIRRTVELADLVRSAVPKAEPGLDPATRTFQALRIAVNDELDELDRGLAAAERLLMPGGRLVVVSFHSLEDRRVKDFLRQRSDAAPARLAARTVARGSDAAELPIAAPPAVAAQPRRNKAQPAGALGAAARRRAHRSASLGAGQWPARTSGRMIKLSTLFWLVAVATAGFAMFAVKYEVQSLADEFARTAKQADDTERDIRVLDAEWAYLNRPDALAQMNQRFLSLGPIATKQLRTSLADVAMRPAPPPPPRAGRDCRDCRRRRCADYGRGGADPGGGAGRRRGCAGPNSRGRRPTISRAGAGPAGAEPTPGRDGGARHPSRHPCRGVIRQAGAGQGGDAAEPAAPGGLAQRADRTDRGEPVMSAAFQFDDNPCRPRHFKPLPCAPVVPDGPARRALDGCRPRLFVVSMAFVLAFVVIAGRLAQVTLLPGVVTVPRIARFDPAPPPPPGRADIIDRHGKLLATTLDSPSLYANPRQIPDPADAVQKLVGVLPDLDRAALAAKLASGKGFVWVKRHLTPEQEYAVNQLGLPGLQFQHEERRIYPYGALLSHAIGYTGIDGNGQAGVERGLDAGLRGRSEPLQLSIDLRLQYILHEELEHVVDDFTAKGGAGLIMNVNTGEVLSMVSVPDFDPATRTPRIRAIPTSRSPSACSTG